MRRGMKREKIKRTSRGREENCRIEVDVNKREDNREQEEWRWKRRV